MKRGKVGLLPLVLAGVTLGSCLLFLLCHRFDNKYTRPRPYVQGGVTLLNLDWYDAHPFFYMADGWTLYRDKLLTPAEVSGHTPDTELYLGRYGGFDLGDPAADPHGQGTYRAVVKLDGVPRTFALELTHVYSRWRLWVNGVLMQSVGFGDDPAPAPHSGMVTFTAADEIDILVAVADDTGFYSGMVYPPALGSPQAVGRVETVRLLLHSAACAAALLTCLLCLLLARRESGMAFLPLALLCLCLGGAAVWPLFQALGVEGGGWPVVERLCYYGLFPALIWLQGRLCSLPRAVLWPALILGGLVCGSVLVQPLIHVSTAAPLMAYARTLTGWKWLCALWLLSTAAWSAWRGRAGGRTLLCGSCVLAAALVMDRLLPLHEPILLGWFVELAGGVFLALAAALVWADTARAYRERAQLRVRQSLAQLQLHARAEQARIQTDYVRRTQKQLHEERSRLTLIRHYLETGALDKLGAYLETLVPAAGGAGEHTGHGLADAILSVQLARAARLGAYVEQDLCRLPESLPVDDGDLTAILMNLLDNALEGVSRVPNPEERWISLTMERRGDGLRIACANAASGRAEGGTAKEDKLAHGFGRSILAELARKYGGAFQARPGADSFEAEVTLNISLPPL